MMMYKFSYVIIPPFFKKKKKNLSFIKVLYFKINHFYELILCYKDPDISYLNFERKFCQIIIIKYFFFYRFSKYKM